MTGASVFRRVHAPELVQRKCQTLIYHVRAQFLLKLLVKKAQKHDLAPFLESALKRWMVDDDSTWTMLARCEKPESTFWPLRTQ